MLKFSASRDFPKVAYFKIIWRVKIMTFKMESFVTKLCSPIILICDDETVGQYNSGIELAKQELSKRYEIMSVCAKDNNIVVKIAEKTVIAPDNFIGEAPVNY